jgi:hypothetical protein
VSFTERTNAAAVNADVAETVLRTSKDAESQTLQHSPKRDLRQPALWKSAIAKPVQSKPARMTPADSNSGIPSSSQQRNHLSTATQLPATRGGRKIEAARCSGLAASSVNQPQQQNCGAQTSHRSGKISGEWERGTDVGAGTFSGADCREQFGP